MMNTELEKIIFQIDKKIKALEQAKKVLHDEFGEHRSVIMQASFAESDGIEKGTSTKKKSRKQAIVDLIIQEGPLTRAEIVSKTGLPLGTIAFVLNDKRTFYNEGGKWNLKAENK